MRFYLISTFASILSLLSTVVLAQSAEGLSQDTRGRYTFIHRSQVPGAPKELLYERLKPFVVEDLNASDSYIYWDETGRDSIITIAFIELPNSPEMQNQVINCKARIDFANGIATLRMSGFNYHGTEISSNTPYSRTLHRMDPIPYASRSWARIALEETLRQLGERMDKAAAGNSRQHPAKASKRKDVKRSSRM